MSDLPLHPESSPAPTRPLIPLNDFQKLMRRWTTLGPYNAAQVVEVSGTPDLVRWHDAAQLVLTQTGLGRPEPVTAEGAELSTADAPARADAVRFSTLELPDLEAIPNPGDDPELLQTILTRELNTAFDPAQVPLRFFVMAKAHSHYLGVVYDHWLADSRAIRLLMQRITAAYQSADRLARLPVLTMPGPTYEQAYRHMLGGTGRIRTSLETLRNFVRYRRGFRVNLRHPEDFQAQLVMRTLPDGLIDRIHRAAKRRQASVNDAFLAALGQVMGELTAADRYRRRKRRFHLPRRLVGLGTIADIRDAGEVDLRYVFGLYLSTYTVQLAKPERQSLGQLAAQVARRTQRVKARHAAIRGLPALRSAIVWWDRYATARHRATFLHKNAPVTAGISNVNMSGSWADPNVLYSAAQPDAPRILDYLRISPTGPLLPLVFTLTTLGSRLSLCVTYRTTAFSAEQIERAIRGFTERLEAFT